MYAHSSLAADFEASAVLQKGGASSVALASLIDSTILKVQTTKSQIKSLCEEAALHSFRSVCVPPFFVAAAREFLHELAAEARVEVCTVVGFPNGYSTTAVKVFEAEKAIDDGATEIDFVQNVGLVKDKNWQCWEAECRKIVTAAAGNLVKIILETSLLTEEEIAECAYKAAMCQIPVIKTSTGFGERGASVRDIEIIAAELKKVKEKTGREHGIKASGGVRNISDAIAMVKVGATRLGTSGGVQIVKGLVNTNAY